MRQHSNTFEVWILGAVLVLFFFLKAVFDIAFEEWVKGWLEKLLGHSVAGMIEHFSAIILPAAAAVLISMGLYRQIRREFEQLSKSKLKCTFDPTDTGCVRPNTTVGWLDTSAGFAVRRTSLGCYYRIKVEIEGAGSISECCGRLVSITRNGTTVFSGENLHLPFAPSESPDSVSKRIHDRAPEYLDFLCISENDRIDVTALVRPSSVDFQSMFKETGVYVLEIVVSSPHSPSAIIKPVVNWTGSAATTTLC